MTTGSMCKSREDKLIEAVERLRTTPFDWREFNCGLAAAEIASSYCGKDYAEKFRPLCQGRYTATKLVLKAGGLDNIMDDLGFEEISLKMARRGDCILVGGIKKRQALGIVYDGKRAVISTSFGLAYVKVLECAKAWRVL